MDEIMRELEVRMNRNMLYQKYVGFPNAVTQALMAIKFPDWFL